MRVYPRRVLAYIGCLAVLATSFLVTLPLVWPTRLPVAEMILLGGLVWLGEYVRVQTRVVPQWYVSFTSIILLAAIPLVGVWGTAMLAAAVWALHPNKVDSAARIFNAAMYPIFAVAGGVVYLSVGGEIDGLTGLDGGELWTKMALPLMLANVVICIANAALMAGVIHLDDGPPWRMIFFGLVRTEGFIYMGYGIFGLLLVVLWVPAGIGALSAGLVLAPLYVARWGFAQFGAEKMAHERTVLTLVRAVETKDLYTRGHSERVARASVMIARAIGMGGDRTESLRYAGILHDVGKMGVPTRVLRKTDKLTDEEFATIALHPVRGLEMVRDIAFLRETLEGILHHHERLDGRGYPMGLSGDDIPEFARIIGVADAFDSMTSTRSYRRARTVEVAVEELRRCAGSQFDPRFVEALITALESEDWQPTVTEVEGAEPAPQAGAVDHDDPTASLPVPRLDAAIVAGAQTRRVGVQRGRRR